MGQPTSLLIRFFETLFWIGLVIAFFVLKENLLFRLGGGVVFQLFAGLGAVCWRLRDRNETFWKYVELLSFSLVMTNFFYFPITTWQDSILRSVVFCHIFILTPFLIVFFGRAYSPELKKLSREAQSGLIGYDPYNKSGSFQLFFRAFFYSATPFSCFAAIAHDNLQILPYYRPVMTYSLLVSALIYVVFARKTKKTETSDMGDRVATPFLFRVIIGLLIFGLIFELVSRKHWFFYIAVALFFLSALKALPAYVKRCEPILSLKENPPDERASQLIKTMLFEIVFAVPYVIAVTFVLGFLVA